VQRGLNHARPSVAYHGGDSPPPLAVAEIADRDDRPGSRVNCVESQRLLVVEDDPTIGATLVRALEAHGYAVQWAKTGESALETFHSADLVVLDLGLPDIDGVDVCRRIRQVDESLPVIMLTARQADVDVVVGLEAGAVDYVRKPFALNELIARIRVHLRLVASSTGPLIEVGDVRIDPGSRRVWVAAAEIDLRAKEFDLLAALMNEAGRVITRERLMSEVWDEHWFGSTKTLDVTMASLRRKLGEAVGETSRITALRNVGYRYETA
jgi:DNA-binding response OmpR family regulator